MFDFLESMWLWIPTITESDSESDQLNKNVTAANGAILDFADHLISLDDMFQAVEYYGADIDDYIEGLAESVSMFGV